MRCYVVCRNDGRTLCGTAVFEWNSPELITVVCSALHKMSASPIEPVQLVDRARPYILLDQEEWTWTTLELKEGVRTERFLQYSRMPTKAATRFLLLQDLHGGADGRVWMVCTTSGLLGVIKFGQPREGEDRDQRRQRLEVEGEVWRQVWHQQEVRVVTLAREPALLMPYVKPVESMDAASRPSDAAVQAAAQQMAFAGYCHLDLNWRHVGVLRLPAKKSARGSQPQVAESRVIFFDLSRVSRSPPEAALTEMLASLQIRSSC